MTPLVAFLHRMIRVDQSEQCLLDIQRAISICDEMVKGGMTSDQARQMLEDLAAIQARIAIADAQQASRG